MTDLQFYRFETDNDSYGSNYGYAIANPMQFYDVPNNLVIYMDRDTNEWVGYSDEEEFGPDSDIETLFQDVASAVDATGYDVIDTDDDSNSIEVASIEPRTVSRRQARLDSIDYGIDIDFESMTVAGRRQNVLAWKKDMMNRRTANIEPGWKMLDFGLYELQNGKSDTFVSEANDGKMHLYSNGLDFGAFDDADEAMANATELLDHYDWSPELPDEYWPIDTESSTYYTDKQASRTARVWKLDLDAPLSMQDKKTFLDNDIDVNENEEDDGTVVLTMTGADGAVADTAELLGLTDNFAQDAYSESPSITSPIDNDDSKSDDNDNDDDLKSEPAKLPKKIDDFEVPEDKDVVKPDDTTETKIKDGIIDLLNEWKNDKATMTASRKTCPICLQTSDDLVHCDAIDLDVCPDCCKAYCTMSDEQDKTKVASFKKAKSHPYHLELTDEERRRNQQRLRRQVKKKKNQKTDQENNHEDKHNDWSQGELDLGLDDTKSDRNASVKKAHTTDIQMMLGEDGYYWHLTAKDDSGNVVKEEDYATEELASEAASRVVDRADDVPVKNVDGLVVPEADSLYWLEDDASVFDDGPMYYESDEDSIIDDGTEMCYYCNAPCDNEFKDPSGDPICEECYKELND